MIKLTSNLTADGATQPITVGKSGRVHFTASGAFGGGTLTPQVQLPDGTFANSSVVTDTLTAGGEIFGSTSPGAVMQLDLTGSTAPTITVDLVTG